MNKLLLVLATVAHIAPHPFGVSSVGASALYAGAYGDQRISWLTPIGILLIGNLLFGFYEPMILAFVYAGFALSALIGRWLLAKNRSRARFTVAIAMAATLFFLLSNFAVWLAGYYPPTMDGLMLCYWNGLPYLGLAMLADAAYCFVLFGLHSVIEQRATKPVLA